MRQPPHLVGNSRNKTPAVIPPTSYNGFVILVKSVGLYSLRPADQEPVLSMTRLIAAIVGLLILIAGGCLPKPASSSNAETITLYGFSIMKEPLEKDIYPAFKAKWRREHGQDIAFQSSFAGSETVTNQILQGVKADAAILSIERDAARLKEGGAVTSDWHNLPHGGIVNKTPFIILVRKGNPHGIKDFPDLARPGLKLIHPDPVSSGGAQWSILA